VGSEFSHSALTQKLKLFSQNEYAYDRDRLKVGGRAGSTSVRTVFGTVRLSADRKRDLSTTPWPAMWANQS
jgi:hypothetical protein